MAVWQSQQPEQQQPRESPYDAQLTMAYGPYAAPNFVSPEETLQRGVLPTPKARPGLRLRSLLTLQHAYAAAQLTNERRSVRQSVAFRRAPPAAIATAVSMRYQK